MLVRLFGSNFRSLRDKFELSMVAADLTREEDRDRGVIEVPITGMSEPLKLLRAVAIFGANASGKSTVLTAGRALRWIGTDSSQVAKPEKHIPPYEPFLLDEKSQNAPIELGCDVVYGRSIIRYEITYSKKSILQESLTLLRGKQRIKLIDRPFSGDVAGKLIADSEANQLYVKGMQPNVSVLSKLAQHGPHRGKESAQPYYKAIRSAIQFEDYADATQPRIVIGGSSDEKFAGDSEYREWIMRHLIQAADVGICDVEVKSEHLKVPDFIKDRIAKSPDRFKVPDKRLVVSFVHEGNLKIPIDFSNESSGTRKLFNISAEWWGLANESGTLLADELGASLHPRLLDRIVRAVNVPPLSSVRSQLIFTTHETGLMESQDGQPPALRRDQVYFTKKDVKGASELYSLAEFKDDARPVHNIRKRYLSGQYGAIPSVEKLSL